MRQFSRLIKSVQFTLILALFSLPTLSVYAEDIPSSPKIAFLRLQVDSSGFRLIEATIVDGTLKSPRNESDLKEYLYVLMGVDSTLLFQGTFENPLIKRYEYEDPDHPGQLLVKVIELPSAELTIRVPIDESMNRLNIYRIERASERAAVQTARRLVASISLESLSLGADK